eukprot:CAMPEP_0194287860 /NCGR_PEP_ID=MMETSP0169-20130528/35629_1 /TAXON_ID=218684 /ORGANISM="Corethron pennatum, Strain L29A3" /LENGTH=357 /DNA_ID=CAMNT_0039034699 /DNA_START=532 /DNA_END=1602 /DNA_ORIENTATION=+
MIDAASSTLYLENILSLLPRPWGVSDSLELAIVLRRPRFDHVVSQFHQDNFHIGFDKWLCTRFSEHLFDLNVWEVVARLLHNKKYQPLLKNIDVIHVMDMGALVKNETIDISDVLLCSVMGIEGCDIPVCDKNRAPNYCSVVSGGIAQGFSGRTSKENAYNVKTSKLSLDRSKLILDRAVNVKGVLDALDCSYRFLADDPRVNITPTGRAGPFGGCPAGAPPWDPDAMALAYAEIRNAGCRAALAKVPMDPPFVPEMRRAAPPSRKDLWGKHGDSGGFYNNSGGYPYYSTQSGEPALVSTDKEGRELPVNSEYDTGFYARAGFYDGVWRIAPTKDEQQRDGLVREAITINHELFVLW